LESAAPEDSTLEAAPPEDAPPDDGSPAKDLLGRVSKTPGSKTSRRHNRPDFHEIAKETYELDSRADRTPHGGRVFEISRTRPWRKRAWTSLIDFSVNLNPSGPPPGLIDFLKKNVKLAFYYPEPWNDTMTSALSEFHSIPADRILAGAGSTPLIYLLPRVLRPRKPVVVAPAFSEYGQGLKASGIAFRVVSAKAKDGFLVTEDVIEKTLALRPDLVFIAHPANPTGRLTPRSSMELLLDAAKRPGGPTVVIDEAFIDFCQGATSWIGEAAVRPNVIVLRSMTKIFYVPGLRLGYCVGDPDLVEACKTLMGPWAVSTPAQFAAKFMLGKRVYQAETPLITANLRSELVKALAPLNPYPSDANYVLASVPDRISGYLDHLKSHLIKDGIVIRDASDMPGLGPGHIRFAVRKIRDIHKLSRSLLSFQFKRGFFG
jgi:threonine-phosphate decarboxylase